MKRKWLFVAVILVAVTIAIAVGFCAGSQWEHRRLVAFGLKVDLTLYHAAERGDLSSVKDQLGTVLVARTHTYRSLFPDARSSKTFLEAEEISREIESKQGPLIEVPFHETTK